MLIFLFFVKMAVMQELQSLYFDYYYSHFTNNETLQPHLEIQNIRNRLEEARQALAAAEAAPVDRPVINVGGAAAAVAAAGGPQDLQDEDDLGTIVIQAVPNFSPLRLMSERWSGKDFGTLSVHRLILRYIQYTYSQNK